MEKCIKPMLEIQQKHTIEVNTLLQRMFIVRKDKFGESIAEIINRWAAWVGVGIARVKN